VESAARTDNLDSAAAWRLDGALREAAFGNAAEARRETEQGLKLAVDSDAVLPGSIALERFEAIAGRNPQVIHRFSGRYT
jgi:hypothetical protein